MLITELIAALNREIPLALAMQDDPVGMQVLPRDRPVTTVAVAYEVDERVVKAAAEAGAELIVAFHPLIYPSLRSITPATRVERTVMELIRRDIGLYILHTAFDAYPEGTSFLLAKRLGMQGIRPLIPDPVMAGAGMGAVGSFGEAPTLYELAERVRVACSAEVVRISGGSSRDGNAPVGLAAILGGSGMSFYDAAVKAGAEAFITADVRYHSFHAANDHVPIIDPGHAESESLVAEGMASAIQRVILGSGSEIRVVTLSIPTNPVRYIVKTID